MVMSYFGSQDLVLGCTVQYCSLAIKGGIGEGVIRHGGGGFGEVGFEGIYLCFSLHRKHLGSHCHLQLHL